jgi:hypothetical protein
MMEETTRRSFLKGIGTVLGVLGLGAGATQVIAKPQPVVDDTALVVEATRLLYKHHYQRISATTTDGKTVLFTDDPNTWMNTTMVIHDGACGIVVYSRDRSQGHKGRATIEDLEQVYRDMCLYAFHNFA